jgi:hypothetical protein
VAKKQWPETGNHQDRIYGIEMDFGNRMQRPDFLIQILSIPLILSTLLPLDRYRAPTCDDGISRLRSK